MTAIQIKDLERRPFFTPKALAEYLSISPRTLRDMLRENRIPSYRIEGSRRIAAEDVDAYLAARRDGRRE